MIFLINQGFEPNFREIVENYRERAFILMMLALDRSLEVSQVSETWCEFRIARVSLHLVHNAQFLKG